jgi:hypothetical protein
LEQVSKLTEEFPHHHHHHHRRRQPETALALAGEQASELVSEQVSELVSEQASELVSEQASGLAGELDLEQASKLMEEFHHHHHHRRRQPETALALAGEQASELVSEQASELVSEQASGLAGELDLEQVSKLTEEFHHHHHRRHRRHRRTNSRNHSTSHAWSVHCPRFHMCISSNREHRPSRCIPLICFPCYSGFGKRFFQPVGREGGWMRNQSPGWKENKDQLVVLTSVSA